MNKIVIDDFAPRGLVQAARATWIPESDGRWHKYENGKLASKAPQDIPNACRMLIERMACIDLGLIGDTGADTFPDVEYLHGAGMHQMPCGVLLGLHLDSERHPMLPWRRVASAVLYLDDCDGGQLELCDENGAVTESIDSLRNRLVLFRTHGQWHRVRASATMRRSLCLFFWGPLHGNETSDRAVFTEEQPRGYACRECGDKTALAKNALCGLCLVTYNERTRPRGT